jgi:hypothetical protein
MLRLMAVFSPELTLDDIIERMVKVTTRFFDVERVGLFLVDLKAQPPTMVLKSAMVLKQTQAEMTMLLGGIAGWIATEARPLREVDAYASKKFDPALDKKTKFRTRQIVGVPIFGQQQTPTGGREVILPQQHLHAQLSHLLLTQLPLLLSPPHPHQPLSNTLTPPTPPPFPQLLPLR